MVTEGPLTAACFFFLPPCAWVVLADVVRAMFNPTFLEELLRPQDVYSSAATRQIFDKLAHTSIMRLNENSMDKVPSVLCAAPTWPPRLCRTGLA